mmetsp:Transcript_8010/g.20576  ORF Transcript_8010/g.20576 Transcript_8010/m.20576 type:complete len:233 (+) Transcript_8010:862-1560(+)
MSGYLPAGFPTVNDDVSLHPSLVNERLDQQTIRRIEADAKNALAKIDPLLRHVMAIKVVVNSRRNFINVRVKDDYVGLLYHQHINDVFYCFFISDKLEPFIIITAVDPQSWSGKLHRLSYSQVNDLKTAIVAFKQKYGISEESYHYTGMQERAGTDDFSRAGGCANMNRSHSSHFHLKMRIATGMYMQRFPVLSLFDFHKVRQVVEPVRYNYSRDTVPFSDVMQQIMADAHP